jgi:S1-C subfamily serine protease
MIRSALAACLACVSFGPSARADVIDNANLFTVQISSAVEFPFGDENKGTAKGAGFLIDHARGWIMTNAHVARRAPAKIRVNFKGQTSTLIERLYIDTHLDLAILKIDPSKIPASARAAQLDCGDEPHAGRPVIAFGHPWSLDYTATRGIVSGTKSFNGIEVLQTDAALNPGNSGGPLIDEKSGVVVGINAATLSKSQTEGMNFAVPAKLACTIVSLLKDGKDAAPPILPIQFAETVKDRELVVGDVKELWAAHLKIGDRIIAVNGDSNARYASRVIDKARGAAQLAFRIVRNGAELDVVAPVPAQRKILLQRGVFVSGLLLAAPPNAVPERPVINVQYVERASLGEEASVRYYDVIHSIDGKIIRAYEDVLQALEGKDGQDLDFVLRREIPRERDAYNYLVRRLEIDRVIQIDEKGLIR